MCTPLFTSLTSFSYETMVFNLNENGLNPRFEISSAAGVELFPIPEEGQAPLALQVVDDKLQVGEGSLGGCTRNRHSICLSGNSGTFKVLGHGGGIGISDVRDGRITVVAFDLRDAPILCNFSAAAGQLVLTVEIMERTAAGVFRSALMDQPK